MFLTELNIRLKNNYCNPSEIGVVVVNCVSPGGGGQGSDPVNSCA